VQNSIKKHFTEGIEEFLNTSATFEATRIKAAESMKTVLDQEVICNRYSSLGNIFPKNPFEVCYVNSDDSHNTRNWEKEFIDVLTKLNNTSTDNFVDVGITFVVKKMQEFVNEVFTTYERTLSKKFVPWL